MNALDRLAELVGIQRSYFDIYGHEQHLTAEARDAFLKAMGFVVADEASIAKAIKAREDRAHTELVAPVSVQRQGQALSVSISVRDGGYVKWTLHEESGPVHKGEGATHGTLSLPQVGLGYHELTVIADGREAKHRLIVAPRSCYVPQQFHDGKRAWGTAVQIYALRTATSWGIGDYGDLAEVARVAGSAGASFVGVSPLHASFPHRPADASPYSPSSRLFLNWIYIDIESVPEYLESPAIRELVTSPEFIGRLATVRAAPLVDYPSVGELKRQALELCYAHFCDKHKEDERGVSFRSFIEAGGPRLAQHALFEALQEHIGKSDETCWGWPVWPKQYHDPTSPSVRAFADTSGERIGFFQYLQWIADSQLARASQMARAASMSVGLYIDLAVGVDVKGSETWANQRLYAMSASVGAPPDELALKGQNWGLPPLIPEQLHAAAYDPFIATIRRCMKGAGALRMDHVMALMRLFWVPPGADATQGAYVSYPFADLLGILALESVRNNCIVIGEDLGTVPDEVRTALAEHEVLSYRVFYFEQTHEMRPKPPEAFPACALVTASTHDLPTLKGFWEGRDLALRAELDLYPSQKMRMAQEHGRGVQKARILDALQQNELALYSEATVHGPMTQELVRAIYGYIARTPSWLLAMQLEDVLDILEQANLPGTVTEHPNWQRRLPLSVSEIGASHGFALLAEMLRRSGR